MRCFVHTDIEAVGLCSSCGRGLCPRCMLDLGQGLACRGRCENDVRDLISLNQHSVRLSRRTSVLLGASKKAMVCAAMALIAVGGATIVAGDVVNQPWVLGLLGGVCFVFGLVLLLAARQLPAADDPPAA